MSDADYTVFVHLVDQDGKIVGQHDGPPEGGKMPTSLWQEGEEVLDEHEIPVDGGLSGKRLSVEVGMYRLDTGERLAAEWSGGAAAGDELQIAEISVR